MQMFANKLLAGVHFGPDYEAEPEVVKVKDPATGAETERTVFPVKRFNRGDVILDPEDLVAKEPGRYGLVSGPRRRETVEVKGKVHSVPTGPGPKGETQPDDLTPARNPDSERFPPRPPGAPPTPRAGTERADRAEKGGKDAGSEAAYRTELEGMTVADLHEHAKDGGIHLHGAKTKADIIDAIVRGDRDGDSGE